MAVFMLVATLVGVAQLTLLGSATRSVRVATLLLAVGVGVWSAAPVTGLAEVSYSRLYQGLSAQPLGAVVTAAGLSADPLLAVSLVTAVLAAVALYRPARGQWGLTDHVLVGAAIGAGLALGSGLLSLSDRADRAIRDPGGGWVVAVGLTGQRVPGPVGLLGWLPAPVRVFDPLAAGPATTVSQHLVWAALAGLGVGLIVRLPGRWRYAGALPLGVAGALSVGSAMALLGYGESWLRTASTTYLWLFPLFVLEVAVVIDVAVLRRGARDRGEGSLGRFALLAPLWTVPIALRFLLARRALAYTEALVRVGLAAPADVAGLRAAVDAVAAAIARARTVEGWRRVRDRSPYPPPRYRRGVPLLSRRGSPALWVVLLVPAVLYFGVGTVPVLADVRRALGSSLLLPGLAVGVLAALGWIGWRLAVTARGAARGAVRGLSPYGENVVAAGARLLIGAGAGLLALVAAGGWLFRDGPHGRLVEPGSALVLLSLPEVVTLLVLAGAAVLAFPPAVPVTAPDQHRVILGGSAELLLLAGRGPATATRTK